MQMSFWMKVAAGCPFRRVITPFPSMTPGDTTVTSHLSQTPEDKERGREKGRDRYSEKKEKQKRKKNKRLKSNVHKLTCTYLHVCFSLSWYGFVLPL